MLRIIPIAIFAAGLAACGASPPLQPITPSTSCNATALQVAPGDGAGPLHRMTPIAATWTGTATNVFFDVHAGAKAVAGETFVDDNRAVFLPTEPLPASSTITARVSVCGFVDTSTFTTGAILHPLQELDTCVGQPYGMDLRTAHWAAPKPASAIAEVMLKWRLAPTLLVMLEAVDGNTGTFALIPGKLDKDGNTVPDPSRSAQFLTADLSGNPYVSLTPDNFPVAVGDGAVSLRSVDLVLGLGENGLEDGRLSAEVDVHGMRGVDNPCAVLHDLTGQGCYPCDETDSLGSCFLLEMNDVTALPTDVALGVIGTPPFLGGDPLAPRPASTAPAVDLPQIPDLRIGCPDGFCPPYPVAAPPPSPWPPVD